VSPATRTGHSPRRGTSRPARSAIGRRRSARAHAG
jgi:hypothetical protein